MLLLFSVILRASGTTTDPWAPFEQPWFDTLGLAEGLPHSITTAIAQDSRGLIWVGTMGGLVRYDGYRVQVFENALPNVPGLPDVYVRALLALPDGGLLIGTNAGGLARFDPANNRFHAYPIGDNGPSDQKIYALATDHHGGVWIATDAGLDHLDLANNSLRHVDTGKAWSGRDFSVLQDRAGNLWLGNNDGLLVRRRGMTAFVQPSATDPVANGILHDQIWSIHEDREKRLWVGSVQAGAAWRGADRQWHPVPGLSGSKAAAGQPTVRAILEASSGTIWMATDGQGIVQYVPGEAQIRRVHHDPAVPSSLPGDSVRALLQDRSLNLWAATDLGIARTDPVAGLAFALLPSPLEMRALANTNINAVHVDSRGRIWIGESAGCIDLIDLKAGSMQHFRLTGAQSHGEIQAIAELDGSIWIGSQGLTRIDPDSFAITQSILPSLNNKPVLSLQTDGSTLLVGTYEGVYRYDVRSKRLDHFVHVPGNPSSLTNNTVWDIARVGSSLWYGTAHGISIERDGQSDLGFVSVLHEDGKPDSLPQDYIGSILQDRANRVWVATLGGLAVGELDPADDEPLHFKTIGPAQGLGSDKVDALLSDHRGTIWASLSNGISRVDPDTGLARTLGLRDGLHVASYIHTAAAITAQGALLFGGLGGLTVIRPQWQAPSMGTALLAITDAVVNGKLIPFGALPENGQSITLDSGTHNLRVDFSLLDYKAPMETVYSYRMDGADDDWTVIPHGSLPSAIYTRLPHGNYTLRLRASARGLHPFHTETELHVVVEPRWYQTLPARLIGILLLIAAFAALVHLRTLYLGHQAVQLQQRIDAQTRDLLTANRRLDQLAGTDGLTGIYNRRRFMELAAAAMRRQGPICIALFDLDHFKNVNDSHGHLAGDAVIRHAVDIIRAHCRQRDLLGRYGGEEFVLCLPEASPEKALETVERIRQAVATSTMELGGNSITITISVGVAVLDPGDSIEHWLAEADRALYEAKRAGRNRSVLAT